MVAGAAGVVVLLVMNVAVVVMVVIAVGVIVVLGVMIVVVVVVVLRVTVVVVVVMVVLAARPVPVQGLALVAERGTGRAAPPGGAAAGAAVRGATYRRSAPGSVFPGTCRVPFQPSVLPASGGSGVGSGGTVLTVGLAVDLGEAVFRGRRQGHEDHGRRALVHEVAPVAHVDYPFRPVVS